MTKREAENFARLHDTLTNRLGIARDDFSKLLKIERTLHRWHERECNGEVEVDEKTGDAYVFYGNYVEANDPRRRHRVANRERGATKRLAAIMARYPKLAAYVQGDPRGCALYVYEKDRLKLFVPPFGPGAGETPNIDSCYSSVGVALAY